MSSQATICSAHTEKKRSEINFIALCRGKRLTKKKIFCHHFSSRLLFFGRSRGLRAHNYANALGKIHFIIAPRLFFFWVFLVLISILFRRVLHNSSLPFRSPFAFSQSWVLCRKHVDTLEKTLKYYVSHITWCCANALWILNFFDSIFIVQ